MVLPSPHQIFEASFSHLPKEEYEVIEELWLLKEKLETEKGWFSRFKLKSSIKELETEAFNIGLKWAVKDLTINL